MNVAREQLEGPLTEHDLTVDYTKAISPKFSVSAGWINYVFPGLDSGSVTNEIYGGLSHASYFNPAVKVFVDFHEGEGTYFNFSASHTYALGSQGFAATPSFGLGYNHRQWIDDSTWSDANFGVKLMVPTPSQAAVPDAGDLLLQGPQQGPRRVRRPLLRRHRHRHEAVLGVRSSGNPPARPWS